MKGHRQTMPDLALSLSLRLGSPIIKYDGSLRGVSLPTDVLVTRVFASMEFTRYSGGHG